MKKNKRYIIIFEGKRLHPRKTFKTEYEAFKYAEKLFDMDEDCEYVDIVTVDSLSATKIE